MDYKCKQIIDCKNFPLIYFETESGDKESFEQYLIEMVKSNTDKDVVGKFDGNTYMYRNGLVIMVESKNIYNKIRRG